MINIIDVDKFIKENKLLGPILSPQLFISNSYNFHPNGLLSEDIFGLDGSRERKSAMSWIDLNCTVIHPVVYDVISKTIERKIPKLLSGEAPCIIGEDGLLMTDPEGDINGMASFAKNIHKIKFRNPDAPARKKVIEVFYKYIKQNLFFMNRLLVISPDYRGVSVMEELNQVAIHPLTELYVKVISISSQLKSVHGSIHDILSYKMQMVVKELYELVRTTISKKQGMIRNLMLGKRMDFSGRSVISPNPNLKMGEVGLPYRMAIPLFEPNIIYGLLNSSYSGNIPEEFHVLAKEYLAKEASME